MFFFLAKIKLHIPDLNESFYYLQVFCLFFHERVHLLHMPSRDKSLMDPQGDQTFIETVEKICNDRDLNSSIFHSDRKRHGRFDTEVCAFQLLCVKSSRLGNYSIPNLCRS